MHRTVLTTVTMLVLAGVAPGTARAAAGPGEGPSCGFVSVVNRFDPSGERYTGFVYAGPIVIADGTDLRSGRVRCSIKVNTHRHSDPTAVSAVSVTTPGVVALPPDPVEFQAAAGDFAVVCTQVEIDGAGTYYLDADTDEWTTDPAVSCLTPLMS